MSISTRPALAAKRTHSAVAAHRPALDGIRALAILLVMTFHGLNDRPVGGFYGVDVFFVLSGYLIAGLLVNEYRAWGNLDLVHFYVRRARRLLPGLVATVIGISLICPLVIDQDARATMRSDGLATLFYVANWHFIDTGQSYFGQFGDPSPYRQMWSLAIEEQFYIVLPVTMLIVLRLTRHRPAWRPWVFVGLASASVLWTAHLFVPGQDPSRMYYGTDCRAQDLLLGCALAIWMARTDRARLSTHRGALTGIGVAGCLAMVAFFAFVGDHDAFTYRGGFLLFALATCAVIASVELSQRGPVGRLFGFRPCAWVGRISYGLYLWHWPVFVMISPAHTPLHGPALLLVRFAVSFALGTASFYLLEEPIHRYGIKRWFGHAAGTLCGWTVLPLTAVLVLFATSSVHANPLATAKAGTTWDSATGSTHARDRVLIVGDSVGFSIGYNFPSHSYPHAAVTGHVRIGCGTAVQDLAVNGTPQPSANGECAHPFSGWGTFVQQSRAQVVVWSLGPWDVFDHVIDGRIVKEESPAYARYFRGRLEAGLKALGGHVQVLIPNVPCYHQPSYVVDGQDIAPTRNDPKRAAALNGILATFAAAHPKRVHIFDVASHVCPGGRFTAKLHGVKVREDGVHYTAAGAALFWKWIMPTVDRLAGDRPSR